MGKKKEVRYDIHEIGKIPPQDVDFEDALLGFLITNSEAMGNVSNILIAECFYRAENIKIYQALVRMYELEEPIDMLTITNNLLKHGDLEDVGGAYYITVLVGKSSAGLKYMYYANVIFEFYVRRVLITLFSENIAKLYDLNVEITSITITVIDYIEKITEKLSKEQTDKVKSSVEKAIAELHTITSNPEAFYIKTKLDLFDNHVYLCPGMILAIASSRSAGKTSYLIKLIKGIFDNNDNMACLWFTMEDPDVKILRAFASIDTGIPTNKMMGKGDKLNEKELEQVVSCMNTYSNNNMEFINHSESIANIKIKTNSFVKKNSDKTIIIAIDNVMLIEDLVNNTHNPTPVEDKIAGSFRNIISRAEKNGHKVILIFLHHMTKEMEAKANIDEAYRPKLSHMKGSTRLADVANAIILINKPGMHKDLIKIHAQLPEITCLNSDGSSHLVNRRILLENMVIAEIAKNRDGEVADDNKAVERYIVDQAKMSYVPLKCIK